MKYFADMRQKMRRRGTMVGDPKIQVFIIYDFGLFYKFYNEKTRGMAYIVTGHGTARHCMPGHLAGE